MPSLFKHEKVRFLTAGILNTGLDFLLLNAIVALLAIAPLIANVISVTIGITISYILNHYYVFALKERISIKKYLMFFCVTGFSSLAIQSAIIYGFEAMTSSSWGRSLFLMEELGAHQTLQLNIAKAIAVAAGMVWNFMLYKYVIFKSKPDETLLEMEEDFQK